MKLTRRELHLMLMALDDLHNHDSDMVEVAKDLNDKSGIDIFKREIKDIEVIKEKLKALLTTTYYD